MLIDSDNIISLRELIFARTYFREWILWSFREN